MQIYASLSLVMNHKLSKNPRAMFSNKLLKIGQVADILGVSVDTLRRWESKGKLIPIKTPGRTRLYTEAQIKAFNPQFKAKTAFSLSKYLNIKLPNTLPVTLGLTITTIALTSVIAVYLSFSSGSLLSSPLSSNQPVNIKANTTLAQAEAMDNSDLNRNARSLKNETASLVGESNISLKQPSVNMASNPLESSVDSSWTITSEDCIRSIIDKGI
jgi:hypothetical protein